jgi:poly(3-hydroxybutyrate) depolymerase
MPSRERVARGLTEQTSRVYPKQEYFLYVPKSYDGSARYRLLVVVHGDGRHAREYAKQFTDFADEKRYIILAPYFPDGERFQQLGIGEKDKTIRFDERLLGLVAEIGGRLNVEHEQFDLFGFSAGGQFAHRFLYFHPERLRSVVVASPGTITIPTGRYDWPAGFGGLDALAKVRINLERVSQVRVMLAVGREDVGDDNLRETDEADRFGDTRLERARTLHEEWDDAKIGHRYVEIKGLDHTLDERIVKQATRFFADA